METAANLATHALAYFAAAATHKNKDGNNLIKTGKGMATEQPGHDVRQTAVTITSSFEEVADM